MSDLETDFEETLEGHDADAFQVESENLNTGFIFKIIFGGLVFFIVCAAVLFPLSNIEVSNIESESALATVYPVRTEVARAAEAKLAAQGPLDEATGVYQVPIDRAIYLGVVTYEAADRTLANEMK